MTEEIKRIDIKEFREKGFLQEVNRQFFHPLGLALEVIINEDNSESLGGIWDYREDSEGMFFSEGIIDAAKIEYVLTLKDSKRFDRLMAAREQGYIINSASVQGINKC